MQPEELDTLMAESARQFNELKVEEGVVKNRLEGIDTELRRLQGETRAYSNLKNKLLERTPQPAEVQNTAADPAGLTPDPFKSKPKDSAANASK